MNRPSYAAVVGSVDSDASKYIAASKAQELRQELIQDLGEMIAVGYTSYSRILMRTEAFILNLAGHQEVHAISERGREEP